MPFSGFSTKRWWNKHKEDSSLSIFEVLLGFFCLSIMVEISQMKAKRKMRSEEIYCRFPFLTSFLMFRLCLKFRFPDEDSNKFEN